MNLFEIHSRIALFASRNNTTVEDVIRGRGLSSRTYRRLKMSPVSSPHTAAALCLILTDIGSLDRSVQFTNAAGQEVILLLKSDFNQLTTHQPN